MMLAFLFGSLYLISITHKVSADCIIQNNVCYVDDDKRILGEKDFNDGNSANNNEWCAQLCSNNGMKFAGTEYGVQCFCGNSIRSNAVKASSDECNMKCPSSDNKDNNEYCGGSYRINIFEFNCSGTPVPPPAESPLMVNPCLDSSLPFHQFDFCNWTLPIDQRVNDAVNRMSLKEKINNLGTQTDSVISLGLNSYDWWSEAAHGVADFPHGARHDPLTPYTTNFAFPITTGMSFNRSLWKETGAQIGREARAAMNVGNAYSTFWTPVINLARDPRWGRNIETPGEDPYLTGQYATYFVRGFQESELDPTHLQASACCKHYVANEMEDTTEVGVHHWRNEFDAQVSIQDLVDSYMAPFQACVELGRVTSLMCSYNAVNGVPSCANQWLLETVARNSWGFDGYVTSDCDADADVYNNHHFTSTPEETVRDVLRAGTDVDCGDFVQTYAQSALDKGLITEEDINVRLRYLFRMRMRLGHFDPIGPLQKIPTSVICNDYSKQLARDGVVQSSVLIKNINSTLPLSADQISSIAVMGPNALLSQAVAGYYGPSYPCDNKFFTVLDAVKQYLPQTQYAVGVQDPLTTDESNIPQAVSLAKQVQHVILALGSDLNVAAEGHDAVNITFSKAQLSLVEQVSAAALNPIVIVILTAVPYDLTPFLKNDKVGAILHIGQPSVQTLGIADLIFGKAVPAGRLVQTIYPESYQYEISIFDFNMRPGPSTYPRPDCNTPNNISSCIKGSNPGRTHRFYTGVPILPFGYGLSYSSFTYSVIKSPSGPLDVVRANKLLENLYNDHPTMNEKNPTILPLSESYAENKPSNQIFTVDGETIQYAVNVTNTGAVDASDVVLGFIIPPSAGVNGNELQSLFNFDRIFLKAGETKTVWLYPQLIHFTQVDNNGHRRILLQNNEPFIFQFGIKPRDDFHLYHNGHYNMGFAQHQLQTNFQPIDIYDHAQTQAHDVQF